MSVSWWAGAAHAANYICTASLAVRLGVLPSSSGMAASPILPTYMFGMPGLCPLTEGPEGGGQAWSTY